MNMDRNTVIGFVLLAVLLFAYLFFSTKGSQEAERQKKAYEDSVANVQAAKQAALAKKDSAAAFVAPDSVAGFQRAGYGTEQPVTVENNVMKVDFTTRGGQPKAVTLKNY